MNTRLLRRVAKHITEEPKRFVMGQWLQKKERPNQLVNDTYTGKNHEFAPCGTAACIAGWTCLLGGAKDVSLRDVEDKADELLGLNGDSSVLFYLGNWPEEMGDQYHRARTAAQRAKVAVARIEHFIKTKGKE